MAPAEHLTWRALWARAEAELGSGLEARRIVERASGWDAGELLVRLDEPVPARAVAFARGMVERRAAGEPLQYVLGRWGFRGRELVVDRRVLIPRPETEAVVEVALREIRGLRRPVVVDLGTGSGAIALSVADEVAGASVWATDVSGDALAVARANLAGLGSRAATRVQLRQGRWYEALPDALRGRLDLIVSNPPYVAEGDDLPLEVALWEPEPALVAGPTGLEAIVEIVAGAPGWLRRPGWLVVEIAPHQAAAAEAMAHQAGFGDIRVRPDMTGRLRALVGRI